MLSCGNKVSPASLLNNITSNDSSIVDPGLMSSVDSQHSQVSLFSSSDIPSSLELFSQPHIHTETTGTASCSNNGHGSMSSNDTTKSFEISRPPTLGGNRYYTRYLSGNRPKQCGAVTEVKSVTSTNIDPVSSKASFNDWKVKQQDQWERKQLLSVVTSIMNEAVTKLNSSIEHVREEMKLSLAEIKSHTEKAQYQCDQHLFTKLLQGQEQSMEAIKGMKDEISLQRNSSELLSRKLLLLNKDFIDALPTLSEGIIKGVTASLQQASVSRASVSTQTSFSTTAKTQHEVCYTDQAVPGTKSDEEHETSTMQDLYHDTNGKNHSQKTEPDIPRGQSHATDASMNTERNENSHINAAPSSTLSVRSTLSLRDNTDNGSSSKLINEESHISEDKENKKMRGKRKQKQSPPIPSKLPCKSINEGKNKTVKPATSRRRSSRIIQKPLNFNSTNTNDDRQENLVPLTLVEDADLPGSKIQRKVSVKPPDRISSLESSFIESPMNALSDTFYSGTSATLSITQNSFSLPPDKGKFHRSNEAAKRRIKVISNLSDSDLFLREIKNAILKNHVDTSESSP